MAKRGGLADYVDSLRNSGYDDRSITNYLIQSGYSEHQIKQALGGTSHHLGGMLVILVLGVLAIGAAWFFLFGSPEIPLSLQVDATQVEIRQGQTLSFQVRATSEEEVAVSASVFDTVGRTDAIRAQVNQGTGEVVVDPSAKPGRYTVSIRAAAGERIATDSFSFIVVEDPTLQVPDQSEPTTPTQPTPEEQVLEDASCPLGCNDYDPCTVDTCNAGVCSYEKKAGSCCGNLACESGETSVNCPQDCVEKQALPDTPELIELAVETYETDPTKATTLCNALQQLKDQDLCFSSLARENKEVDLCSPITEDSRRDSCYMHFVLKENNFAVCDSFTSALMENSCYSLQRLKEAEAAAREV